MHAVLQSNLTFNLSKFFCSQNKKIEKNILPIVTSVALLAGKSSDKFPRCDKNLQKQTFKSNFFPHLFLFLGGSFESSAPKILFGFGTKVLRLPSQVLQNFYSISSAPKLTKSTLSSAPKFTMD